MKYKIPFIRPNYTRFYAANKQKIDKAIQRCLSTGELTLRRDVWDLEKNIAKFVGTKYCATVNSGTDALFLSLLALGIGKGDEVITVSNTFIATIQAIVHTGATPILIDVNEDEQMNVDQIEDMITPRTKAIIPVHYTGAMPDMEKLMKIAWKHKIHVVEDFCQALGAQFSVDTPLKKINAGSFGILNAVSFNTAKLLGGIADGGAVTTNDRKLYETICLLRNHWNVHQLSVERLDYPQPEEMRWAWKSRLSNTNAAFLNIKFATINKILKKRQEIAERYIEAFWKLEQDGDNLFLLPENPVGRIWQEFHLRVGDRENFQKFLTKKGIETLTRDTVPNHKMKGLGLEGYDLPVTEMLARQVIRLPLHEWMTGNEINYVIKSVKKFYR